MPVHTNSGAQSWATLGSRARGPRRCPAHLNFTDESRRIVSSQVTGAGTSNDGEFGANEWLVAEMYEQYTKDRNSVDQAWWPILDAYSPDGADRTDEPASSGAPAPAAAHVGATTIACGPMEPAPQARPNAIRPRVLRPSACSALSIAQT